ncbi:SAUR family protein [Hibiscus syriacus]|uniref:SAUR family protein n=1 Tax=Hibiscus syriacus TaxID=106335 RepID=A0A6A3BMC2_HIBSY|nr:SAUR family protein [Hibiscus syriacus]
MTDHHHHHRFGQLRSTPEILKKTAVHFNAHPFMFIFLSLLLLSFCSLVESGSFVLYSFIDRDPSFKSLLTRLDVHPSHSHPSFQSTRRHTRRPFLHLKRAAILDDDFLSSEDDLRHRSPFRSFSSRPLNSTPMILSNFDTKLGYSNFVADNGILLPKIVQHGVKFKTVSFYYEENEGKQHEERVLDFNSFIKDLNWGAMMQLCCSFLLASFRRHMDGFVSFFGAFWDGSKMGLKRLTGFVLIKWAVRDAVTQLLGLWGYEKEISGFLFTWFLVDTLVSFAFSLAAWIAMVDSRRSGREIIREGWYLMSTLLSQGIQIKCYEAILGGWLARSVLISIGGEIFATVIQAALEVYFMVAWLIFYFVVKSREANEEGRRYGRRELEALIDGL